MRGERLDRMTATEWLRARAVHPAAARSSPRLELLELLALGLRLFLRRPE